MSEDNLQMLETLFKDYSGEGNAVSNYGANLTTGHVGESSYFDGADYVLVNDDNSIDFSTDKSWELWLKRSGTGSEVLFDKSDANTINYKLEFDSSNKLKFSYSIPGGEAGNYSWVTSSEENFSEGTRADVIWSTDHLELNTSKTSGTYTSKIFNATTLASWNSIDWTEGLPYGEGLPDNKGSDSGADMSGNKLLLHMNNNWNDASGEGNDGTAYGDATFSVTSKLGSHAGSFDGTGDYVDFGNILGFERTDTFSVEAWIKTSTSGTILGKLSSVSPFPGWFFFVTSDNKVAFLLSNNWETNKLSVRTDITVTDNEWHHVLATYTGNSAPSGVKIYIDGTSRTLTTTDNTLSASILNSKNFQVSGYDGTNDVFTGLIDEAAVYDVNLTAEEVLKHYKRGALKLNLSVRSCNDAVCDGESYVDVTDNPPQDLNVSSNHFFQYQFDFSTEDTSYSPESSNVEVNYTLFNGETTEVSLSSNTAITNTAWRHVVVTFDDAGSDNFKLYLDNSLDNYATETNLPQYQSNDLYIGRNADGTGYFDGNLDEFRIYNHVLSSEQISNHYNLNYNVLGSEETTRSESYVCNITPTDGVDDGDSKASESLVIRNSPPSAFSLLNPFDGYSSGELPEFNWTASTDTVDNDAISYAIEISTDENFGHTNYSNSGLTDEKDDSVSLDSSVIETYYWRVNATDGIDTVTSDETWNFTYARWEITFNVSSGEFTQEELGDVNISSCTYTGFVFDDDTTNPYGPYGFPPGSWECTFKLAGFYDKTKTFTADDNKIVNVVMSEAGQLTDEEHTWLEAIYTCIVLKDCDLYNLLLEINGTVGNIWEHTKPTDEGVVTSETITNKVVNSSNNLTIDYTISIPIKAGYSLGAYLPVRIGYWFLDENNTTCYNQGDKPTGVADPYCQPLIVETIGPMGGSVSFTVNLQPSLPEGDYSVKRIIDIDPNDVWINYGQEEIDTITVTEDMLEEEMRGEKRIGTTGSGIGPAYSDKYRRIGLRAEDLLDFSKFQERFWETWKKKDQMLSGYYNWHFVSL